MTASNVERVLAYVARRGSTGAICDEAERALQLSHRTVSARLSELAAAGLVIRQRITRTTRSGRPAAVHTISQAGMEELVRRLEDPALRREDAHLEAASVAPAQPAAPRPE